MRVAAGAAVTCCVPHCGLQRNGTGGSLPGRTRADGRAKTLQDSSVQLFVKRLAPVSSDWTLIIYDFKCEFQNRTHVEIATTRTGGLHNDYRLGRGEYDHRLGRGEFIFKARRVSDASSTLERSWFCQMGGGTQRATCGHTRLA